MIEVPVSAAFMVYLASTLLLLLSAWTLSHFRGRKRIILPLERQLYVCEYCHCAYLDDNGNALTQCPQCKSFNKRNAKSK